MDLRPYVESIRAQLAAVADAGGEEARALADRLTAPLESAVRLAVQDALALAAEEITCELAPGAVELRLRGRDPEFVVTAPPGAPASGGPGAAPEGQPPSVSIPPPGQGEEHGLSRINLRLPDHLKARVEQAAAREGLSVNAWLVRACAAALERTGPDNEPRLSGGTHRYRGWAR